MPAPQQPALSRRALLSGLGATGAAAALLAADAVQRPALATAGGTAGAAATASDGLPSYAAGTAQNSYSPQDNAYNWKASNVRRHRAALGAASGGALAAELFIGDSLTAGCLGGVSFDRLHAWPRVYASTLGHLGVPQAGTGLVRVCDKTVYDSRWSFSSGWTGVFTSSYTSTEGATATFSPSFVGTTAAVVYQQGAGGGTFTVSVDGATSGDSYVSVNSRGAAAVKRVVLSGLGQTQHTITVTTTSTKDVMLIGAELYGASGLICHNVAQSGSTAAGTGRASWSDVTTDSGMAQLLTLYAPGSGAYGTPIATVHCALGTNDLAAGHSAGDVTSALETIRGACPDSDFILYLTPQPGELTADDWEPLCTAMYALADSLDVPLIDLQDRFGGYTDEHADMLTADTAAHLNRAGYADWGRGAALLAAR